MKPSPSTPDLPRERVEAHFESLESGLLATQRAFLERLRLDAVDGCTGSSDWPRRVRSALVSVLHSLAESSELARVLSVEVAGSSLGAAEIASRSSAVSPRSSPKGARTSRPPPTCPR